MFNVTKKMYQKFTRKNYIKHKSIKGYNSYLFFFFIIYNINATAKMYVTYQHIKAPLNAV